MFKTCASFSGKLVCLSFTVFITWSVTLKNDCAMETSVKEPCVLKQNVREIYMQYRFVSTCKLGILFSDNV